jgi:DNA-directed RNA polymerase subunit RPC12/RpoP
MMPDRKECVRCGVELPHPYSLLGNLCPACGGRIISLSQVPQKSQNVESSSYKV